MEETKELKQWSDEFNTYLVPPSLCTTYQERLGTRSGKPYKNSERVLRCIRAFTKDCLEYKKDSTVDSDDIYLAYLAYAEKECLPKLRRSGFITAIRRYVVVQRNIPGLMMSTFIKKRTLHNYYKMYRFHNLAIKDPN